MFKVTNLETDEHDYFENANYAYNYISRYALYNDMYITYDGTSKGKDVYTLESWHGTESACFTIEKC